MPKFLKILLYPVVFIVALLLFSVLLFPFDSLKNRVASELESAMGGTYQVTVGTLSPSFPSGAVLKNVEMRPRGDPTASPIKLSEAKLKVAVLPLISGTVEVDFDVKPAQGRAAGSFAWGKDGSELNANLDRFDLGLIAFLTQKAGIAITGLVSGNIALDLNSQDPLKNNGSATLQLLDLGVGEATFGNGTFKVPAMKLAQAGSDSKIDVSVSRGNFEVKTLKLAGGDLAFDSNGKIYGARRADNYRFNLKGSFTISPAISPKLVIKTVMGEATLDDLLGKQKQADGSYPFTVTGRLTKPSIRVGDFKLPI